MVRPSSHAGSAAPTAVTRAPLRAGARVRVSFHAAQTPFATTMTALRRELFEELGFVGLLALDANPYEKPDIVHDLNHAEIPEDLIGRFDLVFDGGTLEHVFDVANALRTVCRFTKPGGRVVHLNPLSNCVDHGFYSFSPILFADFYAANNWVIRRLAIARFECDPATDPWEIRDYRPDEFPATRCPSFRHSLLTYLRRVEERFNLWSRSTAVVLRPSVDRVIAYAHARDCETN